MITLSPNMSNNYLVCRLKQNNTARRGLTKHNGGAQRFISCFPLLAFRFLPFTAYLDETGMLFAFHICHDRIFNPLMMNNQG